MALSAIIIAGHMLQLTCESIMPYAVEDDAIANSPMGAHSPLMAGGCSRLGGIPHGTFIALMILRPEQWLSSRFALRYRWGLRSIFPATWRLHS